MSEVTQIIVAIEQGDASAAEDLLPLVYDELRRVAAGKLAHQAPGQTLQATALVHEAWLRLAGPEKQGHLWNGRRHFFTPFVIGDAYGAHFPDCLVLHDLVVYLLWIDIDTARDNNLGAATGEKQVPIVVEVPHIAN